MSTSKNHRSPMITEGSEVLSGEHDISYQPLSSNFGPGVALRNTRLPKAPKKSASQIVPISNVPETADDSQVARDNFLPTRRDFVIYRLRNRVAELRDREKQLLAKLTHCAEVLMNEQRFLENGLHYDQWETYDELSRRRYRVRAAIALIVDPNSNPQRIQLDDEEGRSRSGNVAGLNAVPEHLEGNTSHESNRIHQKEQKN